MIGPVRPSSGALTPLGLDQVSIEGGFWGDRQRLAGDAMLPHCREWIERTGALANLRAAGAGTLTAAGRRGAIHADAQVYALAEAMTWESVRRGGDPRLAAGIDELAEVFAAAQDPDGYLHTGFGRAGQPERYSGLDWGHELYCLGHLIQAGVAGLRAAGGEDRLAGVAVRAADQVCARFGGLPGLDGHPQVEMALVELYRATGTGRYLDQARKFLDRRGHGALATPALGPDYCQDDQPVRDRPAFAGHAVRALYLACGAVDVATEIGDAKLLAAVVGQWERSVAARTYLTGGMGARAGATFAEDFTLPSDGAHAGTCAAVASVMLCWRLALATGEARFSDLAERTLLNAVAVAPGRHGRSFACRGPLRQRSAEDPRAEWAGCGCCPTNLARAVTSLAGYLATVDHGGLQLHQYAPATIRGELADGRPVALAVETGYPWSGTVTVRVTDTVTTPWSLSLRVPPWAAGATLTGPEGARPAAPGWARLSRTWRAGDQVRLELPVAPRWTWPDPRIDALRGQVAVERGPLVYCAEAPARHGPPLELVEVDAATAPAEQPADQLEPGAVALTVPAATVPCPGSGWPYLPAPPAAGTGTAPLELIPYHQWAHRGPAAMRVWLPLPRRS